ncbi:hypothetical protein HK102_001836, partial [Quaeritorhiza haematococci]
MFPSAPRCGNGDGDNMDEKHEDNVTNEFASIWNRLSSLAIEWMHPLSSSTSTSSSESTDVNTTSAVVDRDQRVAGIVDAVELTMLEGGDEIELFGANETYILDIRTELANDSSKGKRAVPIRIIAATPFAAIRAFETLSQLVEPLRSLPLYVDPCETSTTTQHQSQRRSSSPSRKAEDRLFMIKHVPVFIEDYPRFMHRGLLLDTSRHWYPPSVMMKLIDAMGWAKFNVLHWHIVDSQSFPLKSDALPDLAKGAYSEYEIYTKSDVDRIVSFATDRGIRVVPEFDVPGHSHAWGFGYPELNLTICNNERDWQAFAAQPPSGQLDMTNKEVYRVLKTLFTEMAGWFPDSMMHLGADE